jgi:hypothetical protein
VTVAEYTFSESLAQLSTIGRQLQEASDPDDVLRLEAEADALASHCRALLRRPRRLRQAAEEAQPPATAAWPSVAADGGVLGPASFGQASPAPDATDLLPVEPESAAPASITMEADEVVAIGDDGAEDAGSTLVLPADPIRAQQT